MNYRSQSLTLDKSQWFSGWHNERLAGVARIFTLSTVFTRKSIILRASAFYVLSLETFIVVRRRDTWVYQIILLLIGRKLRSIQRTRIYIADYKEILLVFHLIEQHGFNGSLTPLSLFNMRRRPFTRAFRGIDYTYILRFENGKTET